MVRSEGTASEVSRWRVGMLDLAVSVSCSSFQVQEDHDGVHIWCSLFQSRRKYVRSFVCIRRRPLLSLQPRICFRYSSTSGLIDSYTWSHPSNLGPRYKPRPPLRNDSSASPSQAPDSRSYRPMPRWTWPTRPRSPINTHAGRLKTKL